MLKANTTNPICHSINVKKVFDWISHSSTINLKVPIFIKQKVRVRPEQSSGDFFIDYKKQKSVLLWENSSCLHITGTITITNYSKDKGEINVFINENCLFSIKKNYSRSVTVDGIQSIYLTSNSKHNCSGRFVLKLNKKIKTLEYPKNYFEKPEEIECFFTDRYGKLIDSYSKEAIKCKEIRKALGRESYKVMLANGDLVSIQKIRLKQEGYFCIKFKDNNCCTEPIPFLSEETLLLFAPANTKIHSKIEKVHFHTAVVPNIKNRKECTSHFEIYVSISLKQSIEVTKDNEILLVKGKLIV